MPPFCRLPHISCPAPLCPLCPGRDSCSFVLRCPAPGLVRAAAFLISESPPCSALFCFQRPEEKRKKRPRPPAKTPRPTVPCGRAWQGPVVPPPPPWLLPHKRHSPSILSGFPLHPPNFLSAARGKGKRQRVGSRTILAPPPHHTPLTKLLPSVPGRRVSSQLPFIGKQTPSCDAIQPRLLTSTPKNPRKHQPRNHHHGEPKPGRV